MKKIVYVSHNPKDGLYDQFREIFSSFCDYVRPEDLRNYKGNFEILILSDQNADPEHEILYKEYCSSDKIVVAISSKLFSMGLYNIPDDVSQKINAYFVYGGQVNYRNLVRYFGNRLMGLELLYNEVKEMPFDGIFHPQSGVFTSLKAYLQWYGAYENYVGVMIHRNDFVAEQFELIEGIISRFEPLGIGVVPVFTYASGEDIGRKNMKEIIEDYFSIKVLKIKALINLTLMTNPVQTKGESSFQSAVKNFEKMNIPVIRPLSSYQLTYEEWLSSSQPLSIETSFNFTGPEQMGAIEPVLIQCKGKNKKFEIIEERLTHLCNRIAHYIKLIRKPNSEKRVVIMLHNAPCESVESTLGLATGLNAFESTLLLMNRMKEEGYQVENIPETAELLRKMIVDSSAYSDFRWTPVESIVKNGGALHLMDETTYIQYFNQLSEIVQKDVTKYWGAPIGESMIYDNQIVITGLNFGNVLIMIQPKRGCYGSKCTGEVCLILQNPVIPPSHQFLATYYYIEKGFYADAIIDMGTHGCVEYLPGKASGLSKNCYPDLVYGQMLSLCVYNAGAGGTGILAKRRSKSIIVDHFPEIMENDFKKNHVLGKCYYGNESINLIKHILKNDFEVMKYIDEQQTDLDNLIIMGLQNKNQFSDYILEIQSRLNHLDDELTNIIRVLNGEYLSPVKAGTPEDQGLEMMPTGRNFFIFDDRKIPTLKAYETGLRLADELLKLYKKDAEKYPEKIAMNMISTDITQTHGEQLSQILSLLGVKPIWDHNENVVGLEVISIADLQRPRLDVTIRISGVLRDTYPHIIELMDHAIELVSKQDENPNENYVVMNNDRIIDGLKNSGHEGDLNRLARIRIFGDKPGAFGAGVDLALKASAWKEEKELAEVFVQHSAYAYGKGLKGEHKPLEFIENIRHAELSYDVSSSRRYDTVNSSFGASVNGGIFLLKKHLGGNIKQYAANREEHSREITGLSEAVHEKLEKTLFNPKWKEHLLSQSYEGSQDLLHQIQNIFDWKALMNNIEDEKIDVIVEEYLNDETIKTWLSDTNPYAYEEMARRMLELNQRGIWSPDNETLNQLMISYLSVEGELENTLGQVTSEIQGGNIEIVTSDQVSMWHDSINEIQKLIK